MIVPNLMVRDIRRSIAFYQDIIGMKPMIYVDKDQNVVTQDEDGNQQSDLVFATLEINGFQLMLQEANSLRKETQEAVANDAPCLTGTIYFRDINIKEIIPHIPKKNFIKGPISQWYGINEIYIKDPDGYTLCLGERV